MALWASAQSPQSGWLSGRFLGTPLNSSFRSLCLQEEARLVRTLQLVLFDWRKTHETFADAYHLQCLVWGMLIFLVSGFVCALISLSGEATRGLGKNSFFHRATRVLLKCVPNTGHCNSTWVFVRYRNLVNRKLLKQLLVEREQSQPPHINQRKEV